MSSSAGRVNGARTPSLARLLTLPGAPTYRQIERWVDAGLLYPTGRPPGPPGTRNRWTWPESEQWVAVGMARLIRATDGMAPQLANRIARNARGELTYLGEGVWVRLDAHPREPEGVAFPCPQ